MNTKRVTPRALLAILGSIGLVGTLLATFTPSAAQAPDSGGQVVFEIENLQPADGFFFTEAWFGLHDGDFDLFNEGERASEGLERSPRPARSASCPMSSPCPVASTASPATATFSG